MIKHYQAIVIDDERLARTKLISMLSKYESIEVVGEAEDVPSAKLLIKTVKPDLIFLDIQMPRESGFDLIEQIYFDGKVIFVTAYDEYAVKAFEVNALDYLMKPVKEERLDILINKLNHKSTSYNEQKKLDYLDKLFITNDKLMKFIDIKDIILIEPIGNYTKLYLVGDEKIVVYKSMKEWNSRLPEKKFCRIHRANIINIEYINHVEKWYNNSYRVVLKGIENPIKISKRYSTIFKEKYG